MKLRQRLAAILAADAVGYSRLMSADESHTVAALDAARNIFTTETESHKGRIVDTAGDSVLAIFETATGALAAALSIQQRLDAASMSIPEPRRMRFRIGVHLGDVMEKPDGTIYGDGVNIAARLQSLAVPGGITVSEPVRSTVKNAATFDDQGAQSVKNIADPVHAFSVRMPSTASVGRSAWSPVRWGAAFASVLIVVGAAIFVWSQLWGSRTGAVSQPQAALALPAKPSIAVLPFANMSGDPEQAYFADGMTEDLITDLSKVNGLFVIARNSTFVYKGKPADVRDIAKALGVRYVLEGSVRRVGTDVRVNAQLIDATSGGHLWAERYDSAMKDVFALQDKVTRGVIGALSVQLTKDESARVERKETANAEAYDVFLKGWQHYLKHTPADFKAAVTYFNTAANIDPKYTRAYAALAATYWEASRRFWGELAFGFRSLHDAEYQAEQFLAKAMRNPTPLASQVASAMSLHARQHGDAIAEAQKAIAADPNDADGYVTLSMALSFVGKPQEAVELMERAMRLNPHYPPHYLYALGLAQFSGEHLEAAAASLERAITLDREDYWSQRLLLAIYGSLGRRENAAKLLAAMRSSDKRGLYAFYDPITINGITYWHPFARPVDASRFAEGLRKSGVTD